MTKRIWKYVLLSGTDTTEGYDALFGATGACESVVQLPFDAMLIAIETEYRRDIGDVADIVGWFVVNPEPAHPVEHRRFMFVYTGGLWPERQHLATVSVCDAGPGVRRVVHVFNGGTVGK
jgi:hypothetical protein